MTPGRERALSWLGILVASGLLLVSASQAWVAVTASGAATSLSGTDVTGGLSQALAVVPPLGLLLALTLRARGRQLVGVLLVLVGLGAVLLGLRPPAPSPTQVEAALSAVSLAEDWQTSVTSWPRVFALAGALLVVAAVVVVRRAPRWPSRASRYEVGDPPVRSDDPADAWRALDRGEDPTVGPAAPDGSADDEVARPPQDPISRRPPEGDTMGSDEPGEPGPDERTEGRP
ncbi:Trp biosynthesis-associated membrane protein [Auraticoccus monumenti]|uniref:Trp region conserved hypothetical membrane protein n=1 Tax=Auraticoccus monumenti TaxID=675864 RepID=A0A1G7B3X3_9ACTN|nr:Trp biosynthesis-associated membrane protein [Auraticoccus monumenti]SDE21804.1 trp region conserved hypothetical membrane protein [Auraticoccus monumenti]